MSNHKSQDSPLVDSLINEHLGRPVRSSPTYDRDMAAIEAVRQMERKLRRIERISTTGTVQS